METGVVTQFIPTPVTDEKKIRHQPLQDFEQFARQMHLQYIFHGQNKEPHPFHVKSNWIPPVQRSVALESLESVMVQLAEIKTIKPKHNLSQNEFRAIAELKHNSALNLKKADKGTTTVIMNKTDKIKEAQVLLDNGEHYNPLRQPMVKDTQQRVNQIITQLRQGNHIDDMTAKWLSQTPSPPRIPIFYTLTKIHKPKPVEDRSYPVVKAQQREYHHLWIDCSSQLLKGKNPTLRILQTLLTLWKEPKYAKTLF